MIWMIYVNMDNMIYGRIIYTYDMETSQLDICLGIILFYQQFVDGKMDITYDCMFCRLQYGGLYEMDVMYI